MTAAEVARAAHTTAGRDPADPDALVAGRRTASDLVAAAARLLLVLDQAEALHLAPARTAALAAAARDGLAAVRRGLDAAAD